VSQPGQQHPPSPALGLYLLVCLADMVATLSLFIPFHYVPSIARARGLSATQVCRTGGVQPSCPLPN
jgi:hypothetical protein